MNVLATPGPWNMVASGYAQVTMGLFHGYAEAALDRVPLHPTDHIADIACGPGTLSLAAAGRVASVTALDFSENMLDALNARISDQGVINISVHQGDGQNLPFAKGRFDAAFSMFGLMFFPDRARGYAEMHRTLKPGGHACVASWAAVDRSPLMQAIFGAMQAMNPDIPDPGYDIKSLENPDVLRTEMTDAGFHDVDILQVTDSAEFPSAQAFWDGMVMGAVPVLMLKQTMSGTDWERASARAVAYVSERLATFPATLSATAHLGIGTR